jgi:uncharacterized damage-inducible protein DinB
MAIPTTFPEPSSEIVDPADLLGRYLDFYRHELRRRIAALPDDELRASRLPSGWSPLELLSHLVSMERRWIVWGFLGRAVDDPWDDAVADRWHVPAGVGRDALLQRLDDGGVLTSEVLRHTPLQTSAAPGGRFTDELPTLSWIGFHVLQEYARHLGHLDVAVELAGGPRGESD